MEERGLKVIVVDNCSTHKSIALRNLIEEQGMHLCFESDTRPLRDFVGYELLFLPAYSPDYNPIEESFSCCKSFLLMLCAGGAKWVALLTFCITLKVKAYLRRHWTWVQDSEFPERDLIEACYLAVNGENARGWFRSSGYL
jgi:transposase